MNSSRRSVVVTIELAALVALSCFSCAWAQDGMPTDTIAYFTGACPNGWSSAAEDMQGRVLLPAPSPGVLETTAGTVIKADKAPAHKHSDVHGSLSIPSVGYVLSGKGANDSLGSSGTKIISGRAKLANSSLPFIWLNACKKTASPGSDIPPSGVITFRDSTCPVQTTKSYDTAGGYYVVGLTENGAPGAKTGTPLRQAEVRTHDHNVNGHFDLADQAIAGAYGCCAEGYAEAGKYKFQADSKPSDSPTTDSAAQAPYFSVKLCETR